MKLNERIRDIREKKNYSQEYMANKLGMSQNAYSRLESGQTKLALDRIKSISEILEISFISLLELEDRQVFNIQHNETVNGHVNYHRSQSEKELYDQLLLEKDRRIRLLEHQIDFLYQILEKTGYQKNDLLMNLNEPNAAGATSSRNATKKTR
jgi:transcriptional regulator with XRE-family HTH domain